MDCFFTTKQQLFKKYVVEVVKISQPKRVETKNGQLNKGKKQVKSINIV